EAPSLAAHRFREKRLNSIPGYTILERRIIGRRVIGSALGELPYMTEQGILGTFDGTQDSGENHRRLTPRLQEILHYEDTRADFMQGIEKGAKRDTELLLKKAERKRQLQCDVAILGGGPHGVASAMMLREIFPSFRILLVDENGLGGQWGSYGPNPSYWMNSRIRKANRNLPPIPRTAGNINPLGRYATMELSDVVRGYYALNTEMADVTRINGYLSVDGVLAGLNCQAIVNAGTRATMIVSTPNGDIYDIGARVIINACGRDQKSTLDPSSQEKSSPYYFDTRGVYRHYGNYG